LRFYQTSFCNILFAGGYKRRELNSGINM